MGRDRYRFRGEAEPHFVTCTTVRWIRLFDIQSLASILLESWRFLQDGGRMTIFAYVVMGTHVHFIAQARRLSREVAAFKSYTARRIIQQLREENRQDILRTLEAFKAAHKTDRRYQVWQEGGHPIRIMGSAMMKQKVAYIHRNPVKAGLVPRARDWRLSSARNYEGMAGAIDVVTDW